MVTELCKLGEKYLVDKAPKFGGHTYTPQYHALLSSLRNDTKLLLEIGIGNIPLMKGLTAESYKPGASLRMWRDYFSNAQIIGCDILPEVMFTDKNITTFITDQSNVKSLEFLISNVKKFEEFADIIVDDGSHEEAHQVISFKTLWKLLKPNGIYIIEDILTTFFNRIKNLPAECGFKDAELVQAYNGGLFYDNFVAFRKVSK
jgi:SAM-dependent methyltransferase